MELSNLLLMFQMPRPGLIPIRPEMRLTSNGEPPHMRPGMAFPPGHPGHMQHPANMGQCMYTTHILNLVFMSLMLQ